MDARIRSYAIAGGISLFLAASSAQAQTATTTINAGSGPIAIAVNPVTNKIYVANQVGFLTVIDGATNSTTTVNNVFGSVALAVNPVTNKVYIIPKVYVANASNPLTVIDGVSNSATPVNVGTRPVAVALNPLTNKIYVANSDSGDVTVIDGANNSTINVTVGTNPSAVAVNPVTNQVYVANSGSNNVTVIDGATNSTTLVSAGIGAAAAAVNPVSNKIYVANPGSNNVTVIDGATNSTTTIGAGGSPRQIAVDPVSNKAYVANFNTANLTVIDGATNFTSTVTAEMGPSAVAVNVVTNKVYTANEGSNSVTVVDGATNATVTVNAGGGPIALAVNPVTNKVYAANYDSGNVTVIDGASDLTATIGAGSGPRTVAINPVANKAYVANSGSSNVTVIDGATNSTSTVDTGMNPVAIAVNPVSNKIYVANLYSGDGFVTVIDGATNSSIAVSVGQTPVALAVNPVSNKIYVAHLLGRASQPRGPNYVTVIDGATNTTSTIENVGDPFPDGYRAVVANPVTNKIYLICGESGNVIVIDGATSRTVTLGVRGFRLALNEVSNKVYVDGGNTTTVIDGATNTTTTINAGGFTAVNPVINKVYIANFSGNSVTVVDGTTNSVLATITAVTQPTAVAVNPTTNRVYVVSGPGNLSTENGNNTVTVIDGATNSVLGTLSAGTQPIDVAVNPVTNKAYVSNFVSNDVTVITEQNVEPIPVQASITPLPSDQTTSTTPVFTFGATNNFTSTPVDNLVYQVDTWQGPWTPASGQGGGVFSGATAALQPGFHLLYAYSTDGEEATSTNTGSQSSPLIGNITAYRFLVQSTQVAPTVSLTGAPFSAVYGSTFSVAAMSNASTAATITAFGACGISGNTVTMISGTGTCQVLASWPGDQTFLSAFATVPVTAVKAPVILGPLNASVPFSPNPQSVMLLATLTSPAGTVNEGTVSVYPGNGFAPVMNGTASVIFTVPGNTPIGPYSIGASYSGTDNFVPTDNRGSTDAVFVTSAAGALAFVPITPCRVVDTRNPEGPFGAPGLAAGSFRDFSIPNSACRVPSSAAAYSLNVTVVPDESLGYLTIWPAGQPQPFVSILNSDGRIKANAAIVPAGANGAISVFATDSTQVILDINGYFTAIQNVQYAVQPPRIALPQAFYPLAPCRVADTRQGTLPLGGPSLNAGETRSFPIASSNCNLPSFARAYSLNITVVPHGALGYLTAWPTGQPQPFASTLNAPTGTATANAAIVEAGDNGAISVYVTDASDVIIDVNGFLTARGGSNGLWLYPTSACRAFDTRSSSGEFNGTTVANIAASACGAPPAAGAYVLNATVVPPGSLNYLTLWPDGQPQPNVSTLNSVDGAVTSNMAIVGTTNGSIDAFGSGPTQLFLDLSAYFAP